MMESALEAGERGGGGLDNKGKQTHYEKYMMSTNLSREPQPYGVFNSLPKSGCAEDQDTIVEAVCMGQQRICLER